MVSKTQINCILISSIALGGVIFGTFPRASTQISALKTSGHAIIIGKSHFFADSGASTYIVNLAAARAEIDNSNPLVAYRPSSGIGGRNALDEIYAKGVPATPQSASAARLLLASGKLSDDEKIGLIGILASIHNHENSTGANLDIEFELKRLASDADRQVAAQAAIEYARLGYLPGTETVLKDAFYRGALDANSYYQELAHLIPTSPPDMQVQLMAEISRSSNHLARDVLTSALLSAQEFNAVSFMKSSPDMAAFLRSTQPEFSIAAGEFGFVDAVRYSYWLRASAIIESARTGRTAEDWIVDKLGAPGTDPRKVMGHLLQPEARLILAAAEVGSPVQGLVRSTRTYADQHPANSTMKEIVQGIEARMKNPPTASPALVFIPPTGPVAPPTRPSNVTQ